jgi:hypothetical protein
MKAKNRFTLAPLAITIAGAFALYGCGGGDGTPATTAAATPTATVVAPVVNSPLKDVTVTLTCADGVVGGSGTAADGSVSIVVPTTCTAPFTMAVSGKGTMAGADLKFGTDDDQPYDSATRTALKSVIQATDLGLAAGAGLTAGASVNAPTIDSLTTMVAEKLAKANPSSTEIDAAKTAVAGVTGIAVADLYKNPMSNGEVFKVATLVNEMVASAMKADPTKNPADLIKAMAASTTAKLTDTTIDPAALMGMSAANAGIMQAQMATMQAKADAMKAVADAVAANVASASQAGLTPADAAKALTAALSGAQGNDAATMIAKAKMAQDAMKQMADQMDKLRADTGVTSADLPEKMKALVQGLEAVRLQQDSSIQAAIVAAGGDATKIADAVKQASSMIIGSAPAMLSSVTGATVAELQSSGFMAAAASSITSNFDPAKMAAAMTAAGGDPSKIDFASMGLDTAKMASNAATSATQVSSLKLIPPSALASYPGLGDQVVGMVINRATNKGWLTTGKLQAWVDAIGTALAKNDLTLPNNRVSVGDTIESYFFTKQPDLTTTPPTDLALTIGAETTFTQSTTPITTTPPAGTPTGGAVAAPSGGQSAADQAAAEAAAAKAAADAAAAKAAADAAAAAAAAAAQQQPGAGTGQPTGGGSSLPLCSSLTAPTQPSPGTNCRLQ